MKLDPLSILLNKDLNTTNKIYFISGNETTLIEKIKSKIIEEYKKKYDIPLTKINTIDSFANGGRLFEDTKLFLVENCNGLGEKALDKIRSEKDIFIFAQENSQKIKKIKNLILKDENSYLVECYELDKSSKTKIFNEILNKTKLKIDKNLYWYLIEKLDNKYAFFEDSLNKVMQLDQKDISFSNVRKLLSANNSGKEKIFFNLFKKNKEIIEDYREKIVTFSDVNELYYYCRFYCQLIIDCKNEEEYNKKIPIYLFREKKFLIEFYRKYTSKKKRSLLNLLSSTEKSLRKDNNLSLISGLRFLLSIKKITIS
tara:strand:- start:522 stop:1460 length:939 start_codon:yes stop_codon:yes gene_type:complete